MPRDIDSLEERRYAPPRGPPSLWRNHFERRPERGRPALELGTRTRVGLSGLEMFHGSHQLRRAEARTCRKQAECPERLAVETADKEFTTNWTSRMGWRNVVLVLGGDAREDGIRQARQGKSHKSPAFGQLKGYPFRQHKRNQQMEQEQ